MHLRMKRLVAAGAFQTALPRPGGTRRWSALYTLTAVTLAMGCADPLLPSSDDPLLSFPVRIGQAWHVATYIPDSANEPVLALIAADSEPAIAWSPDGSQLALVDADKDPHRRTGGVRVLDSQFVLVKARQLEAADGVSPTSVAWSPDGSKLAIAGDGGVLLLDHRLETLSRWPADFRAWVSPSGWSEDGETLAVANRGGGSVHYLTNELMEIEPPLGLEVLSLVTGVSIAVSGSVLATTLAGAFLVEAAGSRALTTNRVRHRCPAWSATGSQAAFLVDSNRTTLVLHGSSDPAQLADLASDWRLGCPAWRPAQ